MLFRSVVGWGVLCAAVAGGLEAAEPAATPRPAARNVLLIVSDDQHWRDYGFMGHPVLRTPHLDRLARESLLFRRGYVPSSLCCPSLASIITGRHPHVHRIVGNDPPETPGTPRNGPAGKAANSRIRKGSGSRLIPVLSVSSLARPGPPPGLPLPEWNERFHRARRADPVSEASQDNSVWESIPVGDDLGVMDYVMTEKMIADYREVVGNPTAAYPTVAARHPANLFYRKYRSVMRVPNTGHDSQFFNPPIAGKRIFVKAHVADKYIRREKTRSEEHTSELQSH